MRKEAEIVKAEQEFFHRTWYGRTMNYLHYIECHGEPIPAEDIYDKMVKECKKLEKKYGVEELTPEDEFEWGMINGKLSALRWVQGEDWDFLDT
jgi:hypothetical protein